MKKYYWLVITCFLIGVSLFLMWGLILKNEEIKIRQHQLDSIQIYFSELEVIRKTIRISYPVVSEQEATYYSYIFYDLSNKYNIHYAAFPAMIWIESRFNPTLVSNKECRGLTQLSSAAATDQCLKYKIAYKQGVTEWNDVLNLFLGLDYFSSRCAKNGLDYAIRSYIGGDTWKDAITDRKAYIDRYAKDFMAEYIKVDYINKGVRYEKITK